MGEEKATICQRSHLHTEKAQCIIYDSSIYFKGEKVVTFNAFLNWK